MSSYAHVVHTTAKQVISRSWKERERLRNVQKWKNARAKPAKLLFFIIKYANLWPRSFAVVLVVAWASHCPMAMVLTLCAVRDTNIHCLVPLVHSLSLPSVSYLPRVFFQISGGCIIRHRYDCRSWLFWRPQSSFFCLVGASRFPKCMRKCSFWIFFWSHFTDSASCLFYCFLAHGKYNVDNWVVIYFHFS